jgi:DNA-binding transcriptional regulator YhcF (GntR family)
MLPLTVDPASTTAPFEQVRTQLATLVAQGDLAPGTKLPTVRQLAADLGLAANTVARAYRELEADGVLATYGRRGTFVRSAVLDAGSAVAEAGSAVAEAGSAVVEAGSAAGADTADRARASAEAYVASVRTLGLGVSEATRLVELAWARD